MKERIETLLKSTNREGIDNLLEYMEEKGFYSAPCSGQYHLCNEGGLAEHSLNVYETMKTLNEALGKNISAESIAIVSLLHDLGKMGDYDKPNYVPNILKTGQSKAKPYITNPDLLYIPHAQKSIKLATKFIELTEDEEFAIYYHNGKYDHAGYDLKGETPMMMLLHWSDMWASRVIEKGETDET